LLQFFFCILYKLQIIENVSFASKNVSHNIVYGAYNLLKLVYSLETTYHFSHKRINLLLIIAFIMKAVKLCSEEDKAQIYESIPVHVIKPNFRPSQHINQANFAAICDPSRCHTRIWFTHGRWSRGYPLCGIYFCTILQWVSIYHFKENLDF